MQWTTTILMQMKRETLQVFSKEKTRVHSYPSLLLGDCNYKYDIQ